MVRSQAMLATTIAEYFVEDGRISVDLEIGLADLEAFQNLLPDEIYEELVGEPIPLAERLPRFFAQDLAISADDADPLPGRLLEMAPRSRVRRDEISGEPLPAAQADPDELTVFARLEYSTAGRPASLSFRGMRRTASVGFVVYHRGIPVNDFRYLTPGQTLELDWDDPWYSRFRTRNLRRAYSAPMSGFIYVEPYEVRKEIVLRPKDLQSFVDLGLAGRSVIPVDMQVEVKRRAAEFLRGRQLVEIDGERIEPDLARVNFLERSLRTSRVIDPPVELDLDAAILGVIFVYPTEGLPERVTMDWDLWNERITRVPAAWVDQAGPLPTFLEPDSSVLEWRNFLKNPDLPTLRVLATPPTGLERVMLWGRWAFLLLAAIAVVHWARSPDVARAVAAALSVMVALGGFYLGRGAALSDERAREVVSGLLHNVYRAFDYRDEGQIYDVLARSVEGELLTQIYLETRRGLELANQGGARAKVVAIEVTDLEAEAADAGGFLARATWNVAGSVGHWGHVHQRRNRYRAELSVLPVAGAWKLVGVEILEEERL